jgi:hypothetical protein
MFREKIEKELLLEELTEFTKCINEQYESLKQRNQQLEATLRNLEAIEQKEWQEFVDENEEFKERMSKKKFLEDDAKLKQLTTELEYINSQISSELQTRQEMDKDTQLVSQLELKFNELQDKLQGT